MPRATHRGHCQVCNRIQKLPDGLLSLHGYTVVSRGWGGYFAGDCRGSRALPFERDKTLVEDSIKNALEQAELCRRHAADLLSKPADPSDCWRHHYQDRGYIRGYTWVRVCLLPGSEQHPGSHPKYKIGDETHTIRNTFRSLQDAAERGNHQYASHLEAQAKQLDHFVTFQRDRLKTWRPDAPLLPIGKGE